MAKIKVKNLQVGMTLSTDVCDPNGGFLLGDGCELNEEHIKALNAWGVISVEIDDADMPGNEHLNLVTINNLKEIMEENYVELVDTFINRSTELMNAILKHSDDIDKLIGDVHSLKGSSGTIGAKKLFSICENFESLLRKGKYDVKGYEVKNISAELDIVHEMLRS